MIIQYIIIQYMVIQYIVIKYMVIQYIVIQYIVIQYIVIQHIVIQYIVIQYIVIQYILCGMNSTNQVTFPPMISPAEKSWNWPTFFSTLYVWYASSLVGETIRADMPSRKPTLFR